jgi:hypothetical protein
LEVGSGSVFFFFSFVLLIFFVQTGKLDFNPMTKNNLVYFYPLAQSLNSVGATDFQPVGFMVEIPSEKNI